MKIPCLALISVLAIAGCQQAAQDEKFILPQGFEGAAITVYDQEPFPPLPVRNGLRIHRYPSDGILFTSSSGQYGRWHKQIVAFGDTEEENVPVEKKSSSGRVERDGVNMVYSLKVFGEGEHMGGAEPSEYEPVLEEAFSRILKRKDSEP